MAARVVSFEGAARPFGAMPEPPRPGPLASMGHLPEWLGVENARGVLTRLLRYAEQCGPVARISFGPVRMVVISDPDVAAEVLADPRANHKGAVYGLTRVVLDNVLLLNGEAWATHRRVYRAALRGVDAVGAVSVVVPRFVGEMRGQGTIALERAVFRMVGDIVGHFVAGVQIPDELEPHRQRIQHELAAVGIDLQCQPWAYLSPLRWVRLRRSVAAVRGFFRAAVERRLAAPDEAARDVLAGFLALARTGEFGGDASSLQGGVVNFFFTAHDVLSSSAAWILYLLAQHARVQDELRGALRAGDGELLRRVIKEGLRLYPGYSLFGRTTLAPMTIGGYAVPGGTMLMMSPYVTHRLDRHWEDPRRFDPDRWRGREAGTPPPTARDRYMPFGTGMRGCLASHLAFPVLEAIVAELVGRLELRAVPGHDPGLAYWGTAYPRNGMPVVVRPIVE